MEPVLQSALVGTGQLRPGPDATEPWEAALPTEHPERSLLLRAGAWAVYRAAGRRPAPARATPEPAPPETRPACSPAAAGVFRELIGIPSRQPLYLEALRRLDACGQRLPHAMLLWVIDEKDATVREALRPVLGERGPWLAQFAPALAWARRLPLSDAFDPAEAEPIWSEGAPAERLAVLERARRHDPALAREWLAAGFAKEKADRRAAWLAALAVGLTHEDEPFLERCLDDRSGEVRAQAARLLSKLPRSAFAARMRERAAAGVQLQKGLLRATLTLVRPEALPQDWARDGIAAPADGTNERDGWLRSLVGFVPPDFWLGRLGARPDQVVATLLKADDASPVLLGLADAVAAFEARDWAGPLLVALSRHDRATDLWNVQATLPRRELLRRVPPPELERLIVERLAAGDAQQALSWLSALQAPWGAALTDVYLGRLRGHIWAMGDMPRYDPLRDPWVESLSQLGLHLPLEFVPRYDAVIPPPDDSTRAPHRLLLDHLGWVRGVLALRQRIQEEITP